MKWLGVILLAVLLVWAAGWGLYRHPDSALEPSPFDPAPRREAAPAGADRRAAPAGPRPVALEEVLQLAREGLRALEREVDDYTARLVKQERIDGSLRDPEEMEVKLQRAAGDADDRRRAKRVYLRFTRPESLAGREVIWGADLNDGKLVAHEAGVLGVVRASLDPDSMLAMRGNKYPITEIGFNRLLERLIEKGETAVEKGTVTAWRDDTHQIDGRPAALIRLNNSEPSDALPFSRVDIAIDPEHKYPVHYAAYGWPESEGSDPPLEESYTYHDVRLNVGLSASDFDPDNPDYAFP